MDIFFSSRTQLERLHLHDALAKNRSESLSALLSAVCDTIYTTPFLSQREFFSSLTALEFQENKFRLALNNINFNWTFTHKEQCIIQDASHGLYTGDDVEGAFYNHGGYSGIIALILFFRKTADIRKSWVAINVGCRRWLVNRVVTMLDRQIVEWIPKYLDVRSMFYTLQMIFFYLQKTKSHVFRTNFNILGHTLGENGRGKCWRLRLHQETHRPQS